jgi:hypothetical protein
MIVLADLCERNGGEWAPVVADGLVPEHPLLPHLQQQPRVQVSHLAARYKDDNLSQRQLFWSENIFSSHAQARIQFLLFAYILYDEAMGFKKRSWNIRLKYNN